MEPQARPVATFETVSRAAWRVCRANLKSIVVVTLAVNLPIDTVAALWPLPDDAGLKEWGRFLKVQQALEFWIGTIGSLAITHIVVAHHRGTRLTVAEAFRRALGNYGSALWAQLLYGIALILGLLLLLVPGVVVGVYWFFSLPIIVAHGKSGWQSLRQSEQFARGRWWTVLGRIASFMLLLVLAVMAVSIPAGFLPENLLISLLGYVPANLLVAYGTVWFTMLFLLSEPEPAPPPTDTVAAATC